MKIVVTGGHLTPAYSFAEVALNRGNQIHMIGSAGNNAVEATEMKRLGSTYKTIKPIKFDRNNKLISALKLSGFIIPLMQSYTYLRDLRPHVVVTFGGFNAVPVAYAAKLLHIPVVVHEQTRAIGLANRLIVPIASWCGLSYVSSKPYFPASAKVIGNILRREIWEPPAACPITIPTDMPILFITGGNQGSQSIINLIKQILPELTKRYQVILQYGKQYPWGQADAPTPIISKSWFSASETSWLLHHAHLIISRGGANTTAEIMVAGTPSIIIPLPNTSQDEQRQNALIIARSGGGMMIEQNQLSKTSLLTAIAHIEASYPIVKKQAKELSNSQLQSAVEVMYQQVINLAEMK